MLVGSGSDVGRSGRRGGGVETCIVFGGTVDMVLVLEEKMWVEEVKGGGRKELFDFVGLRRGRPFSAFVCLSKLKVRIQ